VTRTSVVAAALSDGGNAFITGTGFGTNSATIYSLKNTVEANSAGTNWESMSGIPGTWGYAGTSHHVVSTAQVLYGTKSLGAIGAGVNGGFGVSLDTGGTITDSFIRSYVRIDTSNGAVTGQWKLYRWNGDGTVSDGAPANYYMADWFPNPGNDFAQSNATAQQKSVGWETT